ncbi:MAG: iron-sulfur cluster assembly scaffold protein [Armatimonadetes bacterium]|nr:iron-sulfur cluster assembly scaffold protein [Armatimonadota bacterium]
MPSGFYGRRALEHFKSPHNCGEMSEPDGVGEAFNPLCGDRMRLYLRVEGESIRQAAFQAEGCAAAIAAASMTTLLVEGKTLDEALSIRDEDVAKALGGLPESKIHCSILAEDAIQAAVEEARRRRSSGPNKERGS